MRYNKKLLGLVLAAAVGCANCGSAATSSPSGTEGDQPAAPAANSQQQVVGAPAAASASTELGDILVGPDGKTMYGFTNDTEAASTCFDACAEAWPPVIVDRNWTVAPGVDVGVFATTVREDGQLQLVAGKWPLYYYASDTKPGDTTGQGSGDVWFVIKPDGSLVKKSGGDDSQKEPEENQSDSQPVLETSSSLGDILTDSDGRTLYGFTTDSDGLPTCEGDCAGTWPPLIVEDGQLPEGLDGDIFSVVDRPDGTSQLKAGKWPLYLFAGDSDAGDVNGQGSGDVWFVVAPDGSLNKGGSGDRNSDSKQGSGTTSRY